MFMLVQFNKCIVCGSVLQRGHTGDGCLSSLILFKYESRMGHLFLLRCARVRRVALELGVDYGDLIIYNICIALYNALL